MRIALDARYLRAEYSGIGSYCTGLIEALAQIDTANEYYVFVHESFKDTLAVGDNFEIVTHPAPPVSLHTVFGLHKDLQAIQPTLLHSLFPLTPYRWHGPTLASIHDLQAVIDPDFTSQRPRLIRLVYDTFYRWAYRATLERSDYLFSGSRATKETIRQWYPPAAEKTLVVPYGLPSDAFLRPTAEDVERVQEKYGLPERYVFYLGSTRPNKNLARMLQAFEIYRKRHPDDHDLKWVMVIKPDRFFDPILSAIRERGLLGSVIVHEQVNPVEKRVFLSQAQALFFVTRFEGFGFPVLEAQALGRPVLGSTEGSLQEVGGRTMVAVDPLQPSAIADGLERVLHDPAIAQAAASAGPVNAQRFNYLASAKETLAVYQHLIGGALPQSGRGTGDTSLPGI